MTFIFHTCASHRKQFSLCYTSLTLQPLCPTAICSINVWMDIGFLPGSICRTAASAHKTSSLHQRQLFTNDCCTDHVTLRDDCVLSEAQSRSHFVRWLLPLEQRDGAVAGFTQHMHEIPAVPEAEAEYEWKT